MLGSEACRGSSSFWVVPDANAINNLESASSYRAIMESGPRNRSIFVFTDPHSRMVLYLYPLGYKVYTVPNKHGT